MPTYEYQCPEGHQFEIRCSTISAKPDAPECPCIVARPVGHGNGGDFCEGCAEEEVPCGLVAKQVFITPPVTWIPGVDHKTVLDYPGSKGLKAGHVHTHGFKHVNKVSVGAGGALNPRTSAENPIVDRVIPDYKTSTKRRMRKEGLL